MARDFDDFPVYDPLVRLNEQGKLTPYMTEIFQSFLATFIETLQEYMSQNGIFVPKLTQAQRDEIQNPVIGQFIFNTTLGALQVYV